MNAAAIRSQRALQTSVFAVVIEGAADEGFTAQMLAFDPKRTSIVPSSVLA
jgi:hypothetical protein